jgi:hypothetical protein
MSVGKASSLVVFVLLSGCGGGGGAAAEPETPAGATEPPAPPGDPAPGPDAEAAPEKADPPATPGKDTEPATVALEGKDLEAALQALFGDPGLVEYLHLKKPGRAPLKVHGAALPAKLGVIVGSHEVKVVPEPKGKKEAVLVFTKLERTGDEAKIYYRFDVEGIDGRATLILDGGKWELRANRLIEK